MPRRRKPGRAVREPLQIYLTPDERALLDRVAQATGLSRAEVLRRGLKSFAVESGAVRSPLFDLILESKGDDWPADIATRHDDYLAAAYRDRHEK